MVKKGGEYIDMMEQQIQGQTAIIDTIPVQTEQLSFLPVIEQTHDQVKNLKEQLKLKKESLKQELLQIEQYQQAEESLKAARLKVKQEKEIAMHNPICAELADDAQQLESDLKAKKEILSDYVVQYADHTGQDGLHVSGGSYRIVKSAKLVKRKQ